MLAYISITNLQSKRPSRISSRWPFPSLYQPVHETSEARKLYIPHPKLEEIVLKPFLPAVVPQGKWLEEGIQNFTPYICNHSILLGELSRYLDPYYMLIKALRLPNQLITILIQWWHSQQHSMSQKKLALYQLSLNDFIFIFSQHHSRTLMDFPSFSPLPRSPTRI